MVIPPYFTADFHWYYTTGNSIDIFYGVVLFNFTYIFNKCFNILWHCSYMYHGSKGLLVSKLETMLLFWPKQIIIMIKNSIFFIWKARAKCGCPITVSVN